MHTNKLVLSEKKVYKSLQQQPLLFELRDSRMRHRETTDSHHRDVL